MEKKITLENLEFVHEEYNVDCVIKNALIEVSKQNQKNIVLVFDPCLHDFLSLLQNLNYAKFQRGNV